MVLCRFVAPRPVVTPRAVAALFLERQHLARPRASRLTPRRLCRFVEDVGGLQMDSINVVERAHYLTLWSRFGPYDRTELDRLVYRRRLLFEYWAHAACLVPTSMLPWWRRAMLDYRVRHTGWATGVRGRALQAMLAAGEGSEIAVEGSPARWLVRRRDVKALERAAESDAASRGSTLLAPFDSVLWYRERAARLFGFDYRIEV